MVKTLLKGVKREKGSQVNRKLPITPDILYRMAAILDLNVSEQLTFWTACLISFFGMLRKSSLFPRDPRNSSHLSVRHCAFHDWGLAIVLEYSKTIQCKERKAFIALPWHNDKLLCPARTLIKSLSLAGCSNGDGFIFS